MTLFQDIRYALRALRRRPGLTALVVLCLGVGIGASTALFSPVDVFMLRPLPYPGADRLVAAYLTYPPRGWTELNYSLADFRDHREMARTVDLAAYDGWGYNVSGGDIPERLAGQKVSWNYFRVLGTPPARGRAFLPEEERPGAPGVVILTHDLWLNRFGGADVLGTEIRLDGRPHTIVGIMPKGFQAPNPGPALFTPLEVPENASRGSYYLDVIGRLAPDGSREAAAAELRDIAGRLARTYPDDNANVGSAVVRLWDEMFGREFRDGSAIVTVASLLLLLIASANVANLLLARAADRARELAVRTALGATRRRLMTQLLVESVVLAMGGGVLGLALGWAGIQWLRSLFPAFMPRVDDIAMDPRVVAFGVFVTFAAGLIAGLAPAFQASRQDLRETLQEGGRGAPMSRRSGRLRNAFVTAQVAFALVLVVAAGLLVKGFLRIRNSDLGLETASVLSFRVAPPETRYPESGDLRRFARRLDERLAALPGVEAVGLTSILPFSGNSSSSYSVVGEERPEDDRLSVSRRQVTPGYFDALGIALRRGRGFTAADDSGSVPVTVVNEAFVRRHWPTGDALGHRITMGSTMLEIVGVVQDAREFNLEALSPAAMVYLPAAQFPFRYAGVALRAAGDPAALVPAVRAAVRELDPDQPVYDALTLDARLALSIQGNSILARIMMVLAVVALVLALVGVYGVMAYAVSQRTHEIGVRMALGADRGAVVGLIVRQGGRVAAIGCGVGLALALLASRGLSVFLYGVSAFDPVTFGGVVVALAAAALLASWLPARRAARVDPVVALRGE